jgi:hypothetical protein
MNEIIEKVTPLTCGLVWLMKDQPSASTETYKAIDYLTDGLLTATLRDPPKKESYVLIGSNFGSSLYILLTHEMSKKELENFQILIKSDLAQESNILVIDENNSMAQLLKLASEELREKFRLK